MKRILFAVGMLSWASTAYNQCQTGNFFGLEPSYSCPDPSFLSGNPFGGTFHGPGVSNEMFFPNQAGLGTHVIAYTTPASSPSAGYIATAGLTNAPSNVSLNQVFLMDDDLSMALPIGFTFNFFGNNYTEFRISSNGYITFDLDAWDSGCCSGQNLPEFWEPNNVIALAWNDLDPSSGGTIGYTTIGTAPNRILIVEFNDVPHFFGMNNNITVQAKLYESNGHIEIHCTQNISDDSPHTIGVENLTGSCGITALGMNANPNLSVVNEMILFTPDAGSYYGHQTGLPLSLYTGTLTPITLTNDAVSSAIPLGFSFDFYGTSYDQAYVSSNGFLTFSNDGNAGCCSGAALPNAVLPNNLIAFAWNDLNPALGGSIGYTTIGSAPDRTFILDFTGIQHNGGGNPVSVQLKLFESSNLIEINSAQNASNGTAMTMGLENADGTEALTPSERNANTQFSVINERTIFYPYYSNIQITEVISLDDIEAPVPFEPELFTVYSQCGVDLLTEPFAFDNCSGFVLATTDTQFPITESTTVTWTFTDAAGNTTTQTQEVVVEDTTAPIASGFIITITAQGFVTDEVVWSFTDANGNIVAAGGPYWDGGQGVVLEVVNVEGLNGPYSFMGTTAGFWNDNIFSFTVQCQGATVASGTVNEGQTVNVNNIASCNSFTDIMAYCPLTSLSPIAAADNCAGTVPGTHNAVLPITSNTTITWTFDDGNGNITSHNQNVVFQSLNTTIGWVGISLVSNETTPGIAYTWIDCNNNFAPVGSTNQAFTPTVNGNYAVMLQIGSCNVMSECINVTNVGLDENELNSFVVYPNPATDQITMICSFDAKVEVIDLHGKVAFESFVQVGSNAFELNNLASGTYTIRLIGQNLVQTKRLVLNK